MDIRTDRGWIRAGLAVLVTGVLGGGVLTVAHDQSTPRKVTADGVAGPRRSAAAADKPLDLAGPSAPASDTYTEMFIKGVNEPTYKCGGAPYPGEAPYVAPTTPPRPTRWWATRSPSAPTGAA